jgi:hypothetical protein
MMKRILILLLFLPSVAFGQALITIDHTAIDMFDAGIPTYYINLVKQMTFHYQGASHARQMRHGMDLIEVSDPNYAFEFQEDAGDFVTSNTLKELEDGGYLADDYFSDPVGLADLKGRIQSATSDGYQPEVSLLGWSYNFCSGSSDGDYNSDTIQEYIDGLVTLNADEDINDTIFVYHTSVMEPNCGASVTYAERESWNQMIRDAAVANDGILFDQALMEVWNNDNTEARSDPIRAHSDYQSGVAPDVYDDDHANDLICIRKAKAMWVLLATLAGWDGVSGTTDGDADGIADITDNCPDLWNANQADSDGDSIGNWCDNCPSNCNSQQLDADDDGLGDVCDELEDDGCLRCGSGAICEIEC